MDSILQSKKSIGYLCLVVFVVSLSYSFYFHIPPAVDARAYDAIAWNIAQGLGYRESVSIPLENDIGIVRVGPGYEWFLASIYYLFGHTYQLIWILQSLFLALSAYLLFLLSREIFSDSWSPVIGLTAAALIGFSPDLITISAMLMTENIGIFLMILSVYLFFRYMNARSIPLLLLFSISFVSAIFVRTPAIFLTIPMLTFFILEKRWRDIALFFTVAVILFTPWSVRNYTVYHSFIPLNVNSGFNLVAGNHHGSNGEQEPYPILEEYLQKLGAVEANKQATKDAFSFIIHNPGEFIHLTLLRTSIYFSFARPTGFWFHLHGISKALTLFSSAVFSILLFILGSWGILAAKSLLPADKKRARYLLAMLVMMPLAVVGLIVETRYRFLVYPFFALFAGLGFDMLLKKEIEWKPALIIASALFLNTTGDILSNIERIIERIRSLSG